VRPGRLSMKVRLTSAFVHSRPMDEAERDPGLEFVSEMSESRVCEFGTNPSRLIRRGDGRHVGPPQTAGQGTHNDAQRPGF
jgi:hypothetical protein